MRRRFRCTDELKKELVVEVLSGYQIHFIARKYGMHPATLSKWVREYQDEVDDVMAKKQKETEQLKEAAAAFPNLEKKYQEAMKLLGEKELENAILKDLLKKTNPAFKNDLK